MEARKNKLGRSEVNSFDVDRAFEELERRCSMAQRGVHSDSRMLARLQLLNLIIETATPKPLPGGVQWGPPGPPPNPMQKALDAALKEREELVNRCVGIGVDK